MVHLGVVREPQSIGYRLSLFHLSPLEGLDYCLVRSICGLGLDWLASLDCGVYCIVWLSLASS